MIVIKFNTEIKGSSKVDGHDGWIDCESMHVAVMRIIEKTKGDERPVSSPSVSEINFTRLGDMASPELMYQALGGTSLGKCDVHLLQIVDNKPQVYLKLELEEAMISSWNMGSGGDKPTESFSVNFTKMSVQYDKYDGKKVTTGTAKKWDLSLNKTY